MYAMTTAEGTACAETALCAAHYADEERRTRVAASADCDAVSWADCTGNDELECVEHNATDPMTDAEFEAEKARVGIVEAMVAYALRDGYPVDEEALRAVAEAGLSALRARGFTDIR